MDQNKGNKFMFFFGLAFMIAAVVLFIGDFMGESTFPIFLVILGIVFIGSSKFRLLKVK
ncbi:MAG: hypothetical protein JSW08_03380 [archaeon]|nr:MAG: hypothetical protein JSW08_03380 [archaeon]